MINFFQKFFNKEEESGKLTREQKQRIWERSWREIKKHNKKKIMTNEQTELLKSKVASVLGTDIPRMEKVEEIVKSVQEVLDGETIIVQDEEEKEEEEEEKEEEETEEE